LAALFVLIAVVAGGVTLIGRSPSSSPEPSASASPALQATPQPRIAWSENQIEIILSPGESASRSLTFTSTLDLTNIVIEPVPELAPFITTQPSNFTNLPAGQPQAVTVNFAIPIGATLGDYDGTIHLTSGSQIYRRSYPDTLKSVLHVWRHLSSAELGIAFYFPPSWEAPPPHDIGDPSVRIQAMTDDLGEGAVTVTRFCDVSTEEALTSLAAATPVIEKHPELHNARTWLIATQEDPVTLVQATNAIYEQGLCLYAVSARLTSDNRDVFTAVLDSITFP
jgi:hypothetical protein